MTSPDAILDDTGIKRTPTPSEQQKWALSYILATYEENNAKTRREGLRDQLKQHMMDNCEQDEDGNYIFTLEEPISLDGEEWVDGFILQRRVSEFINEDKAWEIVRKYDLGDACVEIQEVLDMDQLYVYNQKGVVSDEDIDSILEQSETFALVKMKR